MFSYLGELLKKTFYGESEPSSKYTEGIKTQVKEKDYLEERELVIGFDFGTSCSKLIIQDVVIKTCYAIPFDGIAIDKQGYFVPSQVFINRKGVFSLESSDYLFNDMKIRLIENPEQLYGEKIDISLTVIEVTVAYIALILQKAITWFLNKYQDIYKNTHILWQLNMGLPSRSYDNKSMCEKFHLSALAGWRTAVFNEHITIDSVKNSIMYSCEDIQQPNKAQEPALHPDNVVIIPEVISEVVGYARSPLKNEGLHLLVDIGASTFDVSTFTLYSKEGEDCYAIYTAEVELLGCVKLHRERLSKADKIFKDNLKKLIESVNGISPLPKIDEYFPDKTHVLDSEIDKPFFKKCKQRIFTVIFETKLRKDPYSSRWKEGLPVFICGGGSNISTYRKLISNCKLEEYGIARFKVIELPKPEGLDAEGLYSNNYHRMAVAYGLSFSTDDIKEIIPPHVIDDVKAFVHEYKKISIYD
ncbi:MAG: hypothetical protein ACE5GU_11555 [Candidatus Scalinduaceae bacterium]